MFTANVKKTHISLEKLPMVISLQNWGLSKRMNRARFNARLTSAMPAWLGLFFCFAVCLFT
jgi:hypothetical protein